MSVSMSSGFTKKKIIILSIAISVCVIIIAVVGTVVFAKSSVKKLEENIVDKIEQGNVAFKTTNPKEYAIMDDVLKNGFFALLSDKKDISLIASKGDSKIPLADIIKSIEQTETVVDEKRLGGEVVQKANNPANLPKPTCKLENEKLLDFIEDKTNQIITLSKEKADKFDISPELSSIQSLGYKSTSNNIKTVKQFYKDIIEQLNEQANKLGLIIFISFDGAKITLHAVEYGEVKKVIKKEMQFISQNGKKTLLPKTFITAFISKCFDINGKPLQRAEIKTKNEMAKDNKQEVAKDNKMKVVNDNETEVAKNDKNVAETKAITSDAITESDNKKTGTKNLNKTINDLQKKLDNCTKDLTDLINDNNDKTIAPTVNQTESEEDENSMTNILEFFNLYKSNENYKNVELFKRLIKKEGKTLADKKQKNDKINRKNIAKNSQHEQINHLIKQISDMGKCIEALKIENMNTQEFYEHLKKRMLENDATVEDILLFHAKNSINPLESDKNKMNKIYIELANYLKDLSVQGVALEEAKKQYNEDLINKFLQLYGELSDEQKNEIKCRLASALGESVFANEDKKTEEKTNINKCNGKVCEGKESTTTETSKSEDISDDDAKTTIDETSKENDHNGLQAVQNIANFEDKKLLYDGTKTLLLNEFKFFEDITEEEKNKMIDRASRALINACHTLSSQAKQSKTEGHCDGVDNEEIYKIQEAGVTTEQNVVSADRTTEVASESEVPVAAEPYVTESDSQSEPEPVTAQGAVVAAQGPEPVAGPEPVTAQGAAQGAQGPEPVAGPEPVTAQGAVQGAVLTAQGPAPVAGPEPVTAQGAVVTAPGPVAGPEPEPEPEPVV